MSNRMLWILVLVILCAAMNAFGQGTDPGEPDTLFIGYTEVDAGMTALVEISFFSDEDLAGLTIPLTWSSPDITLDTVIYTGGRINYLGTKPYTIYNDNQEVVFGAVVFFEAYIAPGTGLAATLQFTVPPGTPDQFVDIDTTTVGPANLLFTNTDASNFTPVVVPGQIKIGDPPLPAHFNISPAVLNFQGTIGFPDPPPQALTVTNSGGGTLEWTAAWDSSWIAVSPSSGTAPGPTQINIDISGLTEGVYKDTIWFSADNTDNSPYGVPVTLNVIKLPPEIEFTPTSFSVSAIQDGANPEDRFLYISNNVPGSDLNWTVSNDSGWLSLSPTSGAPPDSVTLSFDITGLTFGIHKDTIVISDPDATNNPQKVPVTLQIVSNLPVLELVPPALTVIVETGTNVPDEVFDVVNAGEGVMTYSATESSSIITSISPSSGTAPQEVQVGFKTFLLSQGDYYDTIMVTSAEAVNSPQFLEIHFHVVDQPANLTITPTVYSFQYYECWQGPQSLPPSKLLQVFNTGGDVMNWWIEHSQSWLTFSDTTGVDNGNVLMVLDAEGMPVGTYVDTVWVFSNEALNSPKRSVITLNVIPGSETPVMVVTDSAVDVPAQEVFGTTLNVFAITDIYNSKAGCMDFYIVEDIPWLKFIDSTGEAPISPRVAVDVDGYTYGVYPDSFYVYSSSAANSPIKVYVNLQMWHYHGDANWSNNIDVADVVYLINYTFLFGPGPQPEYAVGSVNCDHTVGVDDIVFLVNYIFKFGNEPCGNP